MKDVKQVIVVRKDLNMRKGKIAAQVAHAAMKFIFDNNRSERADQLLVDLSKEEAIWANGAFAKIVAYVESEDALRDLMLKAQIKSVQCYPIIDAGRTEFNGVPTLTCAAFGPDDVDEIDEITGHLPLL